jgi:hypothetical protein
MKDEMDDYLWDGSGEPDPEVERLEQLLSRFRSDAPAPVLPAAPLAPRRAFRPYVPALVAAAALVVVGFGSGLWMTLGERRGGGSPGTPIVAHGTGTPQPEPEETEVRAPEVPGVGGGARRTEPAGKPRRPAVTRVKAPAPAVAETVTAEYHSVPKPLFDLETAHHIEQTELLLRSFMNTKVDTGVDATQIAYEKRRSRELLDRNVMLRLGAEAKGNFPTEDVLGTVEPYLLDIANLKEGAAPAEVRAIQERLQKREIVADLQLYAMNGPKMGF